MSMLLDSSVVIDILRGSPEALRFAAGLPDVPFCSEITRVEVTRGLRSGERSRTQRFFDSLQWVGLDEAIARRAGELGRVWRRSYPGLSTPDLIIGASAQELAVGLATRNVKHFPMFKGLQPPYVT